jgi:hypothetical protein
VAPWKFEPRISTTYKDPAKEFLSEFAVSPKDFLSLDVVVEKSPDLFLSKQVTFLHNTRMVLLLRDPAAAFNSLMWHSALVGNSHYSTEGLVDLIQVSQK